MTPTMHPSSTAAIADLDAAVCSDGAPSARNLLVTVFGDVVAPVGPETDVTVQGLTAVLADFGVNERLVRTSLTRLVNDDLLAVRAGRSPQLLQGRPRATDLFASADERIYQGRPVPWDGYWTVVVLDGAESTADRRAALRGELAAAGLGVVAPNVLASPIVAPAAASEAVRRVGGFEQVVVLRSIVVPGSGGTDPAALARRCLDLAELEQRYEALADRYAAFDDETLVGLDDARAAKLRLLVVSTFRRLVLADPMLPPELLPSEWAGDRARHEAARLYRAVATRSDRHLTRLLDRSISTPTPRFRTP
jgi:phenylacetic acid degradation operon negative regulatory protein